MSGPHVKPRYHGRGSDRSAQGHETRMIFHLSTLKKVAPLFVHAWVRNNWVYSERWHWDGHKFLVSCCTTVEEFATACEAYFELVTALHSHGIVHGDCKTNNILVKLLDRPPAAGEVTFLHRGHRMAVCFCDYETVFLFYCRTYDASYRQMILGRTWYGFRSPSKTRANFDRVKASEVYTLATSMRSATRHKLLRQCFWKMVAGKEFELTDSRPNYGDDIYTAYPPDRTADYNFVDPQGARDMLVAFKQQVVG